MKSIPIIVTGARGRIGSAICRRLRESGRHVFGYSRVAGEGNALLDDLFVDDMLARPHVLIHCAWSSVPMVSETHRGIEWKVDFPLLWRLLETISDGPAAAESRLVFFSSGGTVYGNAGSAPSRETDPLCPRGWHGFAKVQAEQMLAEFERRTEFRIARVRLANPYGFPGHTTKPQGVIPFLIEAAREERPFSIWGDGKARKDYLHVSDMLAGLDAILDHGLVGPVNLCQGESVTLLELVAMIEEATGKKIALEFGEAPSWDVSESRLDNSRLRTATGWAPKLSLREGIQRVIEGAGQTP